MSGESEEKSGPEAAQESFLNRAVRWFDGRIGLSYEFMRPAPAFTINPFYWLGALAVVAFAIQAVSGMLMLLYYIPTPTQAYSSTLYIFQSVSYGRFLETVHLYTAYAMIMLAFMHLMRGYFVSVHKKPRELMWVTGMLMGFVTLGFGFTGYLLPWTVISKSATDVGVGMMGALPQPFSSYITFLVTGGGGDAATMLRFFELHIVVLPAVLLLLLFAKMYMLESHGVSEPVLGPVPLPEKKRKLIPIFPNLSLYLLELAALFGVAMLLISVAFPLTLPPQYTAALASQYTPQPDWYFLWIYQILKIKAFEGAGLPVALSVVTLIFILLVILPFVDRGETRRIASRTIYVTLGLIFVTEIAVLTVWGYLTPGKVIPTEQAVLLLGGAALAVALVSTAAYKVVFRGLTTRGTPTVGGEHAAASASRATRTLNRAMLWTSSSFVFILALGAFGIGGSISAAVQLVLQGANFSTLSSLGLGLSELSLSVLSTIYLLYRLDLGTGSIKRRVRFLEIGWKS